MKCAFVILALFGLLTAGCSADDPKPANTNTSNVDTSHMPAPMPKVPEGDEAITVAAGCFWCTEAMFQQVPGVVSVTSGYTGGTVPNPTYEAGLHGRDRACRGVAHRV